MNDLKKNRKKEIIVISLILLISFAVGLVVPYAQHLANGRNVEWNYYIGKGIIVSIVCLVVYLLADKYGTALYEKNSKAILYIGTAVLLVFAIFESPLSRIEITAVSKIIAYVYAVVPFLEIITLCAFTFSLNDIISDDFSLTKVAFVATGFVMAFLLNNIFKVVLLIVLCALLIKNIKRKSKNSKASTIIVAVLCICLIIYLIYVFGKGLKTLLVEWNSPSFMAYVSRNVWSQAKLFGTMDDLNIVGGSISNFSLLWLISFLGIIPAAIIVIALIFLVLQMLKQGENMETVKPLKNLALIYFCVRLFLAILANCGIILVGLMTPIPLVMDTVSGMLCSSCLLGLHNTFLKNATK